MRIVRGLCLGMLAVIASSTIARAAPGAAKHAAVPASAASAPGARSSAHHGHRPARPASAAAGRVMPAAIIASPRPTPCADERAPPASGPLQAVLAQLAARRHFEVRNLTAANPPVSVDGGTDMAMVHSLAGQANLIVTYAPRPGCPRAWRIDTVWVLPKRGTAPRPAARAPDVATLAFQQAHGGHRGGAATTAAVDPASRPGW